MVKLSYYNGIVICFESMRYCAVIMENRINDNIEAT